MRAIYFVLLSFLIFYIGIHIRNKSKFHLRIRGLTIIVSLLFLVVSFILALLGK